MKKNISLFICIAFYCFGYSQASGDKIPAAVTKGFNEKFPGASKPSWEIENGKYECAFKINGSAKEASFDKEGKWLDTEVEVKISALPKAVSDVASKQLVGYKIISAEKVDAANGKTYYDIDIAKGSDRQEARFTPAGELNGKWKE